MALHVLGFGSSHSMVHSFEGVVRCWRHIRCRQGCSCVQVDECQWSRKDRRKWNSPRYKDPGCVRVLHSESGFVHRMGCSTKDLFEHLANSQNFRWHRNT